MVHTWNNTFDSTPTVDSSAGLGFDDILDLKQAVRERLGAEHRFDLANQLEQGEHKPGSAVCFVQGAAPASRANGTSLGTGDAGVLWYDTANALLKVWNGTDFVTVTNTHTFSSPDTTPLDVEGVSFLDGVLSIGTAVEIKAAAAKLPELSVTGGVTAAGTVSAGDDRVQGRYLRLTVGGAPSVPSDGDIWIV